MYAPDANRTLNLNAVVIIITEPCPKYVGASYMNNVSSFRSKLEPWSIILDALPQGQA